MEDCSLETFFNELIQDKVEAKIIRFIAENLEIEEIVEKLLLHQDPEMEENE